MKNIRWELYCEAEAQVHVLLSKYILKTIAYITLVISISH